MMKVEFRKKEIINENVLKSSKKKIINKSELILKLMFEKNGVLKFNAEDKKLIQKLINAFCRKRTGVTNSKIEVTAASMLWQYSRMNHLWEDYKNWSRQSIADLFCVKAKTIGNKTAEISKALKIDFWDERFCREEVSDSNPLKNFVMTSDGMILSKDIVQGKNMPSIPLKKGKEDYYFEGLDFLEVGNVARAIKCFKKALEIDEAYVDAYNGLGSIYFYDNLKKAKAYFKKAYELTKEHFNNQWPASLEWGVLENRQYLRAIFNLGLVFWREKEFEEAKKLFMLLLKLNNNDNQGARYVVASILKGLTWEESVDMEESAFETGNHDEDEKLFEEQNKIHEFY